MKLACVIGSGPSGVACASALREKGIPVLMLDGGLTLEPERQQAVGRLAAKDSAEWDAETLAFLKGGMSAGAKGLPQKLFFGSDFPYRDAERQLHLAPESTVGLTASLALGGYSNNWGSALLPYVAADMQGWPITREQLSPHYAAVEKITGITGRHDGLEEWFPLAAEPGLLEFSAQASHFYKTLTRNQEGLRRSGIRFGASRMAVNTDAKPSCAYCGLCMYGCPYGLIYNSAATLKALAASPDFQYQPDRIVERVSETGGTVQISGKNRVTGEPFQVEASRAYLGAGAISSTRILLESLAAYQRPVSIKDSQYFLLPLLFAKGAGNVEKERLHTMSQLFLEIDDPRVSPHFVHLQAYTYSDLIGQALRQSMGPLGKVDVLARQLESRIVILQGFIHSDHSSHLEATLDGEGGCLHLKAGDQRQARQYIHRIIWKLLKAAPRLGAVALPPVVEIAPVGRSYHCGGSFPMSKRPDLFESDVLGRPQGFERLHIVDATCFPSIPATTITMSVMANAHRIGVETAAL